MFANELSFVPPADDLAAGKIRAEQYVLTMRQATSRGIGRALQIPYDFWSTQLSSGYHLYNWRNDTSVERENRQFLVALATKMPYLADEAFLSSRWAELDCLWQTEKSLGLKAAYVSDGLALSLQSNSEWDRHEICCEIQAVTDSNIQCWTEKIHHASSPEHIKLQTSWILQRIQNTFRDGKDLWKRIGELFPLLDFCPGIEEQMSNLPTIVAPGITRGLFYLNSYCMEWKSGPFNKTILQCNASPESEPTLNKYRKEHTFLCPDGNYRIFSWHAKLGMCRIHFDPTLGAGRILVGYVGKHLPTVTGS